MKVGDYHTARIIGPDQESYQTVILTEIKEGEEIRLRSAEEKKEVCIEIKDGSFVIEGNFSSILKIKS